TAALSARLQRTRTLAERADARRAELNTASARLGARIAQLDAEEARLTAERREIGEEAAAARRRTQDLAARAVDLKGLADIVSVTGGQQPERRLRSFRPSPDEIARVGYRRPASGRVARAFGRPNAVGVLERGLTLATRAGAVVTAPAAGMVTYSGPFRSYEEIVIIDHGEGLTTLLSGLTRTGIEAGAEVRAGAPVGRVGEAGDLYVELRRNGTPVDPMLYMRGRRRIAAAPAR
ncbi:MAG: peptidoglycan DD-metalloendopeptidase family protein, partial [Pseudomonadota bacterium]